MNGFKLNYNNGYSVSIDKGVKTINGILPTLGDGSNAYGIKIPFNSRK